MVGVASTFVFHNINGLIIIIIIIEGLLLPNYLNEEKLREMEISDDNITCLFKIFFSLDILLIFDENNEIFCLNTVNDSIEFLNKLNNKPISNDTIQNVKNNNLYGLKIKLKIITIIKANIYYC